jgi:hypothetical protein
LKSAVLCPCRCAVDALQHAEPHVRILIYVRAGVTAEQLVQDASSRFNVKLRRPIEVGAKSYSTCSACRNRCCGGSLLRACFSLLC